MDIIVSKKTELMGIMLLISDYKEKYPFLVEEMNNKEYRNEILNTFSKFKNTKTIKLLNKIINTLCFNYDAPIYLIEQVNDDLSYDNLPSYPFKERLESSNLVIDFLNSLKEFSTLIKFNDFYNKHLNYYNEGITQINNLVKDYKIVKFLKDFYKMEFKNINFIINLMFFATHGNYGINVNNDFICNQCLRESENNKINFIDSVDNTLTLYVHEFSHSVVNPLTRKYSNITMDYFNDIKDKMIKQAYNLPETIIDEHIVRGIELVFLKYSFKDSSSNYVLKWKKEYEEIGFIYINEIFNKLDYYYTNKQMYKDFEEFFPELLTTFKSY